MLSSSLLYSFYIWEDWGTVTLAKIIQLITARVKIHTWIPNKFLKPWATKIKVTRKVTGTSISMFYNNYNQSDILHSIKQEFIIYQTPIIFKVLAYVFWINRRRQKELMFIKNLLHARCFTKYMHMIFLLIVSK